MTPVERRTFARHLSLAEMGEPGQARLMATIVRAAPDADARAWRWAEEHATRAGARVDPAAGATILTTTAADVRAIAGEAWLEDAAAFFLGSLAALEHLRRTVLGPGVRPLAPIPLVGAPSRAGSPPRGDRP